MNEIKKEKIARSVDDWRFVKKRNKFQVTKTELEDRVDIWRDRCDRRSRKNFCELRKFLGKVHEMLYNLTPK